MKSRVGVVVKLGGERVEDDGYWRGGDGRRDDVWSSMEEGNRQGVRMGLTTR